MQICTDAQVRGSVSAVSGLDGDFSFKKRQKINVIVGSEEY
jgi:hypothetical protein